MSAEQLPEVRHRLGRRVRNLRNVIIHQTLTERFVEAFRKVVQESLPVVVAEVRPGAGGPACVICRIL